MSGIRSKYPPKLDAHPGGRSPGPFDALPILYCLEAATRTALVKSLRTFPVQKHQSVFLEGAPASHLYLVVAGAVMAWKQRGAHQTQVTGFLFPGDLTGTLVGERTVYNARAVIDGTLARVPQAQLSDLADRYPDLRHALYRTVTTDFALAQDQLLILGAMSAAERVATALLQLERRQRARGIAAGVPIWLPMRRTDLASYLGLELPTLSRAISRLRQDGIVACPSTCEIAIRNRDALVRLSCDLAV